VLTKSKAGWGEAKAEGKAKEDRNINQKKEALSRRESSTMDKLTVITTTIAGTFKVQIDEPNKTFAVYLIHPDTSTISARASCLLEAEINDLLDLGYMQS